MASLPSVIIVFLFWFSAQCIALSLPPTTVYFEVGQNVEVLCPRSPDLRKWDRISWETDNGQFLTSGNKLVIKNAAAEHEGKYLCRKQQFAGGHYSDTAAVHLILRKKAENDTQDEAVDDTVDEEPDVTSNQTTTVTSTNMKNDTSMSPKLNESSDVLSKNETGIASDGEEEDETPKNVRDTKKDDKPLLLSYTDNDDETNDTVTSVPLESSPKRTTCLANQIRCKTSLTGILPSVNCVYKHWLCDGENDCYNGWDEENCNRTDECFQQTYNCKDSKLEIPMGYRCDNENDCESGDDEENCLNPSFITPDGAPRIEHILESIKGHQVDLKCSAQGFPSPVIVWRHNGQSVKGKHSIKETCSNSPLGYQTTESTLSVNLERDGDAGYYTCEANNSGGRTFSPDYLLRVR